MADIFIEYEGMPYVLDDAGQLYMIDRDVSSLEDLIRLPIWLGWYNAITKTGQVITPQRVEELLSAAK